MENYKFNAPLVNCPRCEAQVYLIGRDQYCNVCEYVYDAGDLWEKWNEGLLTELEVNNLLPQIASLHDSIDEAYTVW